MDNSENRNYIRLDSLNLLDYLIIDREGRQTTYSMGRTLDVSEQGMKLEVTHSVASGDTLLITVGLENDLVDLTGECIHCKKNQNRYILGIEFSDISDEGLQILKKYIVAFKNFSADLEE
ncbi:MAG TPA: PilZ domain-containing protein [Desulfobacterales bacterium]|nr:PilZ domain-containing protein [Desulfobacterales bacterium]